MSRPARPRATASAGGIHGKPALRHAKQHESRERADAPPHEPRAKALATIQEPAVDAGLQALGLALTPTQRLLLLDYLRLLQRWTGVYNLTALRDAGDMVSHHLLDCLTVLPRLGGWLDQRQPASHGPGATTDRPNDAQPRILDVGSGGGLPGVLLAICRPDWSVTCVDTVAKKAGFIRQAAAELRLNNLAAEHARVETLAGKSPRRYDVVTARAFASLPDLVRLTRDLLAEGGVWMAMKGQVPEDEIRALPGDIEVFHVEQLDVPGLDARRCLVWMRPRTAAR